MVIFKVPLGAAAEEGEGDAEEVLLVLVNWPSGESPLEGKNWATLWEGIAEGGESGKGPHAVNGGKLIIVGN